MPTSTRVLGFSATTSWSATGDSSKPSSVPSETGLKQIMRAAVGHLHAFLGEVRLTEGEWKVGIHFLSSDSVFGSMTHS